MKLLISLVLALTVQGEVFEPASESSTTPEIAEKSAKGEDEENHLHDLIANPEDEAVKNLKPEALEGAKATTEMAGGVGAAVLGEKLKSLRGGSKSPPVVDLTDPMVDPMVDLMDHMDGILEILTVLYRPAVNAFCEVLLHLGRYADLYRSKLYRKLSTCVGAAQKMGRRIGCCWLDC